MSASQQCHARGYARARYLFVLLMSSAASAQECDLGAVAAHVQEQLRVYGPRSASHEYFGFIYRAEGVIASAVVRGQKCRGADQCTVDIEPAAKRIPQGAKVLGEWHTHTHQTGSRLLSLRDVRGAHQNVRIRCYSAFYAGPDGEIYAWDPRSTSVATAMATRTSLGRYALDADAPAVAGLAAANAAMETP